ncbi:TonB family protein [Brevundimonas sp.]|uniref:TonB family protein n=1 Tax=Brevundimonas sp. TaxID=1871086 RepID=UPI003783DDDB
MMAASAPQESGTPAQPVPHYSGPIPRVEFVPTPRYPRRARRLGVSGEARVECRVNHQTRGMRDCRILEETPAGYGFGDEALSVMRRARLDEASVRSAAPEAVVSVRIPFNVIDDD